MSMFEYTPLTTSTAFRLIKVSTEPNAHDDDVHFDLIDSEIEAANEYTALSYQWGSDIKTHAILLNGQNFPLHENLWHFLKQLTLDKDDRLYWVDAICINQNNHVERAEQVSRMSEIFTSAYQVTVWLGPLPHIEFSLDVLLHDSPIESTLSSELGISKTMTQVNALNEILNLKYWRRAWILPELVLGKRIRLKSLSTHMLLAAFSEKVKHYMPKTPSLMTEYEIPRFMEEQRTSWTRSSFLWSRDTIKSLSILAAVADLVSGAQPFHLESWLPMVQSQGCKDARDRVYSLLGLLSLTSITNVTTPLLSVNYSKPVGFVYWDTIFSLLLSGSDKPSRRFIAEIAHLITYTIEHRPEQSSSADNLELISLRRPLSFISLSGYVSHPATSSRLSVLAGTVLMQSFLTAISFNHRHFYEDIGTITKDHSTIHIQSEDAIAAYLGQNIAIQCEPYATARFGREVRRDEYTWRCKECHQLVDDMYDYYNSATKIYESTLSIGHCKTCSEDRSRIYTAILHLTERKGLDDSCYQWRNTFKSTYSGPEIATLEYQTIDGISLLTVSRHGDDSHDQILCLRAPPNFYRQADSWITKDSNGHDFQVLVPPYIFLAVIWKSFVPEDSVVSFEGNGAPAPATVQVPWLRLLKHVCGLDSWDCPSLLKRSRKEKDPSKVE